jgi:hypothetical protein
MSTQKFGVRFASDSDAPHKNGDTAKTRYSTMTNRESDAAAVPCESDASRQIQADSMGDRILAVARGFPTKKAAAIAADVSVDSLDRYIKQDGQGLSVATLILLAKAGGVTVEWLATGASPMRPGEAPQAPVAGPEGQAPQAVADGLPPRYAGHNAAVSGVKSAVSLAVAALGDQSQHIEPERLADLIDAAHQLLQEGADPALVRRLIAAAAGP